MLHVKGAASHTPSVISLKMIRRLTDFVISQEKKIQEKNYRSK